MSLEVRDFFLRFYFLYLPLTLVTENNTMIVSFGLQRNRTHLEWYSSQKNAFRHTKCGASKIENA